MRRLGADDRIQLEAFLDTYWETSMFLRGNLALHGMEGSTHRHATTFWADEDITGICGVLGCTEGGLLMIQCPNADARTWSACREVLQGRTVLGGTGAPGQIEALMAALSAEDLVVAKSDTQPLYWLDIDNLKLPNCANDPAAGLRKAAASDQSFLEVWHMGLARDTGMDAAAVSDHQAMAARFIEEQVGRLLTWQGTPVAMTNLNARAEDCVQIGGVYVPPEYRRRGFAQAVVGLHMRELSQHDGLTRAILFAASEGAARAYEGIGFEQIGFYAMHLLEKPHTIEPHA